MSLDRFSRLNAAATTLGAVSAIALAVASCRDSVSDAFGHVFPKKSQQGAMHGAVSHVEAIYPDIAKDFRVLEAKWRRGFSETQIRQDVENFKIKKGLTTLAKQGRIQVSDTEIQELHDITYVVFNIIDPSLEKTWSLKAWMIQKK